MRVYISGKITGVKDLNKPKFEEAEAILVNYGYRPLNPHKLKFDDQVMNFVESTHGGEFLEWERYMRRDIIELMRCNCIAVLDDWTESKGARIEVLLARDLGMAILEIKDGRVELMSLDPEIYINTPLLIKTTIYETIK